MKEDSNQVQEVLYAEFVAEKDQLGHKKAYADALKHVESLEAEFKTTVYFLRYNDPDRQTVHSTEISEEING